MRLTDKLVPETPPAVTDWFEEIKKAWAKGPASALDLARIISAARNGLPHGGWTALWKSCRMPFAKRKGYLLVAIGQGLGWANVHVCAHLPTGLRTLYHLAKLDRTTVERLIQERVIHPTLKESEARELAAQLCGETSKARSARAVLRERLRRFAEFVATHLADWSAEERALATEELARLIEQIDGSGGIGRNVYSRNSITRCDLLNDQ